MKAVGAAGAALPFYQLLEDSVARAAGDPQPLRFVTLYHPHGIAAELWVMKSTDTETAFDLTYENCSLQPFDDAATYGKSFKDRLLTIEGLDLAYDGHDAVASILTGTPLNGGKPANSSLDQFLAVEKGLGASTKRSNIVLGVGDNGINPGNTLSYSAGGWDRILDNRAQRIHFGIAPKQATSAQRLPQHHAQREHVGATVHGPPHHLLGRHVLNLSLQPAGNRLCHAPHGACHPEVDHLHDALEGDQDVLR